PTTGRGRTNDTAGNPAITAAAEKGNTGVKRTGTATNARSRPTHANPASANGPDPLSTPVPDTYRFCRWEKAQPDTTTSTGPKTKPDKNPMKCHTAALLSGVAQNLSDKYQVQHYQGHHGKHRT